MRTSSSLLSDVGTRASEHPERTSVEETWKHDRSPTQTGITPAKSRWDQRSPAVTYGPGDRPPRMEASSRGSNLAVPWLWFPHYLSHLPRSALLLTLAILDVPHCGCERITGGIEAERLARVAMEEERR